MPTYEYECGSCGHQFEVFQPIKDKPRKKCPECGKGVKRLIGSGSAVIFKGSGFYQTDYRSSDYKKKAESEKKAMEKPADKADKSESGKKADQKQKGEGT